MFNFVNFDSSKYRAVVAVPSKTRADEYIRMGWELISAHTELDFDDRTKTMFIDVLGWPIDAGEPVRPPRGDGLPKVDEEPAPN